MDLAERVDELEVEVCDLKKEVAALRQQVERLLEIQEGQK